MLAKLPSIELMNFFEERASGPIFPNLESKKTEAASSRLRDSKAIDGTSMSTWIEGWLAPGIQNQETCRTNYTFT